MRLSLISAVAVLLLTTLPTTAQECVELANVLARDTQRFASQDQIEQLNQANLCQSEYRFSSGTQKAQIEASYNLFSGKAAASSQEIEEFQSARCEGQFGYYWQSKIQSQELITVSQTGADVIKACLDQRAFRITGLTLRDTAMTATFKFGGAGKTVIDGVAIVPASAASCSLLLNGNEHTDLSKVAGTELEAGANLTVACEQKGKGLVDGRVTYQGGIISVATRDGTGVLPLFAYTVPLVSTAVADDLAARINELERKLKDEASARQAALQGLKDGTNGALAQLFGGIPPGEPNIGASGDWMDPAYVPGTPHRFRCPDRQLVYGVSLHMEDGHLKGTLDCAPLNSVAIP